MTAFHTTLYIKEFSVMAFEVFKKRVSAIVSKAGASVRFHHEDDGRHFAHCSDGVTIIGNLSSPSAVSYTHLTLPTIGG